MRSVDAINELGSRGVSPPRTEARCNGGTLVLPRSLQEAVPSETPTSPQRLALSDVASEFASLPDNRAGVAV